MKMQWKPMLAAVMTLIAALTVSSQDASIWTDAIKLMYLGNERVERGDLREGLSLLQTAAERAPNSEPALAALANGFHLQRRLDEAGALYARLIRSAPPAVPSKEQEAAILRFAPRVFQTLSDPFPLKDAVAIHHPVEPLIAYHFFWADDIDFPDDNDPCDHEVVWVRYDRSTQTLKAFHTYFHGRLLSSPAAVEEAQRNGQRPRVNVQWGKHGSLPYGWEDLSLQANSGDIESRYLDLGKPMRLADYNRATYLKLSQDGRRLMDHPLSRDWPRRFTGSWNDFVSFAKDVDVRGMLMERRAMAVSAWNNAVLQQQFLHYNFRPKTEWPEMRADSTSALDIRRAAAPLKDRVLESIAARLPDDLPPASVFKPETPRYPNIWFYGAESEFATYTAFIEALGLRFKTDGYTADAVSLNEGADLALSVENLQPWHGPQRLSHDHAIHIRFFWKRLEQHKAQRVRWGQDAAMHWRVAASVHYEVEHANPLHADVEVCPFCGRTGAYAGLEGNLVERVHDPVGLELLLWGTVRGQAVRRGFLPAAATDVVVTKPLREDINTEAIAFVKSEFAQDELMTNVMK